MIKIINLHKVGDEKQLPPTVLSKEAVIAGYGGSMFKRFIDYNVSNITLQVC